MLLIGAADELLFNWCKDHDTALAQCSGKIGVHGVFINIDVESAHTPRSAVSSFECFGSAGFRLQICFYLVPICVIICKRRVNLRQGEMAKFSHDLLGNEPGVVPLRDSLHGHASAGDARTPTMDSSATLDEAANWDDGRHRLDYIGFQNSSPLRRREPSSDNT